MQHFLKPASGTARAEIIAAELLKQLLLAAVHRAIAAFYASFAQGTPGAAWMCAQKQ
jgi:hypothetical protein